MPKGNNRIHTEMTPNGTGFRATHMQYNPSDLVVIVQYRNITEWIACNDGTGGAGEE